MKKTACIITIFMFMAITPGCAPVISEDIRRQVSAGLPFKDIFHSPQHHSGKMVIWGGVIIKAANQKRGTLLEVLHTSTDMQGRPIEVDRSEGRFLALYNGFLDVAVYAKGREVTIAGRIKGKQVSALGEIEYSYPLILIEEIHLWPIEGKAEYIPYPYLRPHYPWGWPHGFFH